MMANSLRVKLKKLSHDGKISQTELDELLNKLDGHDKQIRDEVVEKFMVKAMTKFYNFDVEHGYPTNADTNDILLDVANELKGEQNE